MYLTSGEHVSTSRLRICWSPVCLYFLQSASVSSWEMRRRLPVSGFISGGTPWKGDFREGTLVFSSNPVQAFSDDGAEPDRRRAKRVSHAAASQARAPAADDVGDPFRRPSL